MKRRGKQFCSDGFLREKFNFAWLVETLNYAWSTEPKLPPPPQKQFVEVEFSQGADSAWGRMERCPRLCSRWAEVREEVGLRCWGSSHNFCGVLQDLLPPCPLQWGGWTQTPLSSVVVFDFPGGEKSPSRLICPLPTSTFNHPQAVPKMGFPEAAAHARPSPWFEMSSTGRFMVAQWWRRKTSL